MLFTHAVRIEQFREKLDVQGLVSAAAAGKSAHLTARKLLFGACCFAQRLPCFRCRVPRVRSCYKLPQMGLVKTDSHAVVALGETETVDPVILK